MRNESGGRTRVNATDPWPETFYRKASDMDKVHARAPRDECPCTTAEVLDLLDDQDSADDGAPRSSPATSARWRASTARPAWSPRSARGWRRTTRTRASWPRSRSGPRARREAYDDAIRYDAVPMLAADVPVAEIARTVGVPARRVRAALGLPVDVTSRTTGTGVVLRLVPPS